MTNCKWKIGQFLWPSQIIWTLSTCILPFQLEKLNLKISSEITLTGEKCFLWRKVGHLNRENIHLHKLQSSLWAASNQLRSVPDWNLDCIQIWEQDLWLYVCWVYVRFYWGHWMALWSGVHCFCMKYPIFFMNQLWSFLDRKRQSFICHSIFKLFQRCSEIMY